MSSSSKTHTHKNNLHQIYVLGGAGRAGAKRREDILSLVAKPNR
jgi:hypothetical protein